MYIYETKTPLRWNKNHTDIIGGKGGRVIGEFVCDKVETFVWVPYDLPFTDDGEYYLSDSDLKRSGMTYQQFDDYGKDQDLYGWHISELKIYDEPKPLSDFTPWCNCVVGYGECDHRKVGCSYQQADYNPDGSLNLVMCGKRMARAPQSWCYVEDNK